MVNRQNLINDAAFNAGHRIGTNVLLGNVDAFNGHMVFIDAGKDDALLTLVLAGDDDDFVTFTDALHLVGLLKSLRERETRSS